MSKTCYVSCPSNIISCRKTSSVEAWLLALTMSTKAVNLTSFTNSTVDEWVLQQNVCSITKLRGRIHKVPYFEFYDAVASPLFSDMMNCEQRSVSELKTICRSATTF